MKTAPGTPLLRSRAIQARVKVLAREIDRHYRHRPVIILGLMNGSLFFLVDLLRALPRDFRVECWRVHSYRGTTSSGRLNGLEQCWTDFSGHDVLIVDDILDTGVTLEAVQKHVIQCGARRVDACVLLKKTKTRQPKVKARWFGFAVDDDFVIGYGLDLDGRFRSLNDIRVLAAD